MNPQFQNNIRTESMRLHGYDYRNEGAYFITICTHQRDHHFGECINGEMLLNKIGLIAQSCWSEIPNHFPNSSIDEFVVMPNHIHGILIINEKIIVDRGMPPASAIETHNYVFPQSIEQSSGNSIYQSNRPIDGELKNEYYQNLSAPAKSVSTIIRAFKSAVTSKSKPINQQFGWQSRFHDHIIRSQAEFGRIANYIAQNPMNWKEDRFC